MKHRGLLILAVLLALLPHVLFAGTISASGSLIQTVDIKSYISIAFTSQPVTSSAEFNSFRHDSSYENLLSIESAPGFIKEPIISNENEKVFLSVITNQPANIKVYVKEIQKSESEKIKGLIDGKGNGVRFYLYNEDFQPNDGKSDGTLNITQEIISRQNSLPAVFSYALTLYAKKSDVIALPGGIYRGFLCVEITGQN